MKDSDNLTIMMTKSHVFISVVYIVVDASNGTDELPSCYTTGIIAFQVLIRSS